MEKLKYATLAVGVIALVLFIFARTFGIEEWKWLFFVICGLCALTMTVIEYKERKGIFGVSNSKTIGIVYVVSIVLVLTAAIIHIVTGGATQNLLLIALLVFLGTMGWLRLRRKSND